MIKGVKKHIFSHYQAYVKYTLIFFLILTIVYSFDSTGYFADTIPLSGDTGFHTANFKAYQDEILSEGKLEGWISNTSSGMAFPTFYPPILFYLLALFSLVLPWTVVYKLLVVVSACLFPFAVDFFLRKINVSWSGSLIVFLGLFPFLFQTDQHAFGGNLLSVIIGEVSYMLSLSLLFFFLGYFFIGLQTNKYKKRLSILFFLMCLTHPVPFIIACGAFFFVFFQKNLPKTIPFALTVGLTGSFLSMIWIIPYVLYERYLTITTSLGIDSSYGWTLTSLSDIIPSVLLPYFAVLCLIIVCSLLLFPKFSHAYSQSQVYVLFLTTLSAVLFSFALFRPVRFIPMVSIFVIIFVAHFLTTLFNSEKTISSKPIRILATRIVVIIAFLYLIILLHSGLVEKTEYAKFTFDGYNPSLLETDDLHRATLYAAQIAGGGRVDSINSPIQLTRLITNASALTDLFDHTFSARFIDEIHRIGYNDASKLYRLYDLYNVRSVLVKTDDNLDKTLSRSNFFTRTEFGSYAVYSVDLGEIHTVIPLNAGYREYGSLSSFVNQTFRWMNRLSQSQNYIVYSPNRLVENKSFVPPSTSLNCEVTETLKPHRILFNTTCPNTPHLIKMSYFPRWKSTNGEDISLISPSFMVITPTKSSVEIVYMRTWVEYLSIFLFIVGVLCLCLLNGLYGVIQKCITKTKNGKITQKCLRLHHHLITYLQFGLLLLLLLSLIITLGIVSEFDEVVVEHGTYVRAFMSNVFGDTEQAIKLYEKIEISENLAQKSDIRLSEIYFANGEDKLAIESILAYLQKDGPNSAQLRFRLAEYHFNAGDDFSYRHELSVLKHYYSHTQWYEKALNLTKS